MTSDARVLVGMLAKYEAKCDEAATYRDALIQIRTNARTNLPTLATRWPARAKMLGDMADTALMSYAKEPK